MPGGGGIYQGGGINNGLGFITNTPFGIAWSGDTTHAPSADALYNYLITIGTGYGNTAYVRTGGDDSSAVVGNILLPFKTIGAAITAIGFLPNSLIAVDAGNYVLTDADTPFGLKAPGSTYDLFFNIGCTVQYFGTYGMYQLDGSDGSDGNIYGSGDLLNFANTTSKFVDGKNNFAFNKGGGATTPSNYQCNTWKNESSSASMGMFRFGTGTATASRLSVTTRAWSRGGLVVYADINSRVEMFGGGTYDNIASGDCLRIEEPIIFNLHDCTFTTRGNAFGNTNTVNTTIINTTNGTIKFIRAQGVALNTPANYKFFNIANGGAVVMSNFLINSCTFQNRQTTAFTSNGFTFFSNDNFSFKCINTHGEKNTGGAGVITNLIITGLGFMVEPNIV